MTRGSKRCRARACFRQAAGTLVYRDHLNRLMKGGADACQEHLEEATRREILLRIDLRDALLIAARP